MILTSFLKLREEIMSKIICIYPATGISTVSIEENNIHEFSAQIIFWTRQIKNAEDDLKKKFAVLHCSQR